MPLISWWETVAGCPSLVIRYVSYCRINSICNRYTLQLNPFSPKRPKWHLRNRRLYPLTRGLNKSQFIDCPPKKVAVEERLPFLESGGRRWRFDCITALKIHSDFNPTRSHKLRGTLTHFSAL